MRIEERVLKVISEHTNIKAHCDSTFAELELDYIDKIEVSISIEEEFDIEISDEKYFNIKSVKDLISLVTDTLY